jgi:signal transduction histidine kinase
MIPAEVERELLENAGVLNVVLRRDAMRQLVLSSDLPGPVTRTVDLRDPEPVELIRDALVRFVTPGPEIIRVIAEPARGGGMQIEAAIDTEDLHDAMIEYGLNILLLSLVISAITALFLFLAVRRLMVLPIRSLVAQMNRYAAAPEDARRVIEPRSRIAELREAETTLQALETQLTANLRQKERLAALGAAVAKISHDLRNILTTAQLLGDRLERSDDPTVKRVGPKILASLGRAVSLTEGTLAFGRAEEPPPALARIEAGPFLRELCETEQVAVPEEEVAIRAEAPPGLVLRADPEQLHRVLSNLVRNARQALQSVGRTGTIVVTASETAEAWELRVADDGPGLAPKAREHLFRPFQGNVRKGGTGLGLAIARELVQGHGGELALEHTGEGGTTFRVTLPREVG